jgi:hypothetical protein
MVFHSAAAGTAPLSAVGHLVDGGPGAAFGFFGRQTAGLVALLDVLGLALLFVGVTGFVAARHKFPSLKLISV